MNKLNERLALIANISVVLGIIFLAVELQQNTQAIQAQTRDSITEKEMEYYGWVATSPELADVLTTGNRGGFAELIELSGGRLPNAAAAMYTNFVLGTFREFENSHYQYEHGLFTPQEFEARRGTWEAVMRLGAYRDIWAGQRERFAPRFRAEIDRIVAEVGG